MNKNYVSLLIIVLSGCSLNLDSPFKGDWSCDNDMLRYSETKNENGHTYGPVVIEFDIDKPHHTILHDQISIDEKGFVTWSKEHKYSKYQNVISVSKSELVLSDNALRSIIECKKKIL